MAFGSCMNSDSGRADRRQGKEGGETDVGRGKERRGREGRRGEIT